MCIDCLIDDFHLPKSFEWYATPYRKWFGKCTCFLLAVTFIKFIWMALDKGSIIISLANADSWFITEYHFHPINTYHDCFYLAYFKRILFYLCVNVVSFFFLFPLLRQNPILFSYNDNKGTRKRNIIWFFPSKAKLSKQTRRKYFFQLKNTWKDLLH